MTTNRRDFAAKEPESRMTGHDLNGSREETVDESNAISIHPD
jgi:hypothetical protein